MSEARKGPESGELGGISRESVQNQLSPTSMTSPGWMLKGLLSAEESFLAFTLIVPCVPPSAVRYTITLPLSALRVKPPAIPTASSSPSGRPPGKG